MKQVQRQQLQQKFSPQQIQLMRLLQLPVTDLEQAIKEEVEKNPLLDAEAQDEQPLPQTDNDQSDWDIDEDDDYGFDYREHLEQDPNQVRREFVVSDNQTVAEQLQQQLGLRHLSERQLTIATEIIGTLDDAGYLSRDLALIANDLAFRQGIEASPEEVEAVLHIVQSLEPAGIGARSLQECLSLQLERSDDEMQPVALDIVRNHFDDFANHRYERICTSLDISEEQLEDAAALIRRLNPKPAGSSASDPDSAAVVIPDIILSQHDGQLQFYLNDSHLPRLSLNSYYTDMLHEMEQQKGDRETVQFLRSKQADAQGFIDLLQQRHDTIVRVMQYIVRHQRRFLLSGDPDMLQPMRQREVAEATGLDISTISRMANSKYMQTDFGTIALKECFSKGMAKDDGEEVSVETIKQRIADMIEQEDKQSPLSDDAIARQFNERGLPVARRTVAKYREQMGIPVARLRRAIMLLLLIVFAGRMQAQMSYYDSIMAARLQAAEKAKLEPKPATPAAPRATRAMKPAAAAPAKATGNATSEATTPHEAYIVPVWYDAFPANRVNPLGRTKTDMLPDEINLRLVADSSDFCFPVKKPKTSNYGWRWNRGHHGVDIALQTGDPVHAAFGGTVRIASRMGGYGNCVVVRHANGLETLYGHLSKINVTKGQKVVAGEVVGLGGSTGNSTGPHLHFECRFLYQTFDPEWILDFKNYTLRTRRLHLDKTYFGIRKPQRGEKSDYKADGSIIREGKKRPTNKTAVYDRKDF